MSNQYNKTVFISYAKDDLKIATRLREILAQFIGDSVWLRDFDLNDGELFVKAIDVPMTEAKWFVIILSSPALKCKWLRIELNVSTTKALEDDDFRLVLIKVDNCKTPEHLEAFFKNRTTIDLAKSEDIDHEFLQLAELIEKTESTQSNEKVYVDRGAAADNFSLISRRNRVVFVLGLAGIGKTSFCLNSVAERLRKKPLIIKLTRGHSADLLARQVIQKSYSKQPTDGQKTSDDELIQYAIDALHKRAEKFYVFLDNAEVGLDPSNRLLPFLESFVYRFTQSEIGTHLVIATTRKPDYGPGIAQDADILQLNGLEDIYVRECIDLWLQGDRRHDYVLNSPDFEDLVKLISGHPLAAKMIASYLKIKPVDQLLSIRHRRNIQLKLAEYILRSADHVALDDLHRLILQILAAVGEPMLLEDMLSVKELRRHPIDAIQKARWELLDWFLIEQNGELMSLHNFLEAYFSEQLNQDDVRLGKIASDFGEYAYHKSMSINADLKNLLNQNPDDEGIAYLSNSIFRYALPANRLLRSIGKDELVEDLPIQIKGTIREMVFYYYQTKHDYRKAFRYAEEWLRLNSNDLEIILYQIRCYRNFRDDASLKAAERLIRRVEKMEYSGRLDARLFREKALIAQFRGDYERAKEFFRKGIEVYTPYPYPENYIGLAQLLLRELDELPLYGFDEIYFNTAEEALELLEEAKSRTTLFDRFYLGIYVEALIYAGRVDTALPLLKEALNEKPEDERLNYRMAEILRKYERLDEAEEFAKKALRYGASKAALSLANILHGQALILLKNSDFANANKKLENALDTMAHFRPEYGHDREVADTITSKIYRALNDWKNAAELVGKYPNTKNRYTIYEQSLINLEEAKKLEGDGFYGEALSKVRSIAARLLALKSERDLSPPLAEVLSEATQREARLELALGENKNA